MNRYPNTKQARQEEAGNSSWLFVNLLFWHVALIVWTAVLLTACPNIQSLLFAVAEAAGPQQDPRAAARAVGQHGLSTAAAIARDATRANTVPGYSGTNPPERNLTGATIENAARARLANQGDPGGSAGRDVIAGTASRPAPPNLSNDAGIARANAIRATPDDSTHGANGLATGGVTDCPADVTDAHRGGTCGGVSWCVGADCGGTGARANTGFVRSVASLNMVLEMGGDEFDRRHMTFFPGERQACQVRLGGLANCCDDKGLLVDLHHCPAHELAIARERDAGRTVFLGERCVQRILNACLKRERGWCVFGSKLGRMLHEQARPQLGIGWSGCRGFAVSEIERIDFDRLDLSDFFRELADPAREPGINLPDQNAVENDMRDRVRVLAGGNP